MNRHFTSRNNGFTIVELLIVIVVIGILAAITIVAFNGVQAKARDSQRVSSITTIKKHLELFYVENGYYPNSAQMTNSAFRQATLQLPDAVVRPPGVVNSIGYCWSIAPNSYCYVAYRPAGSPAGDCTAVDERCIGYTLSYRTEADPTVQIRVRDDAP